MTIKCNVFTKIGRKSILIAVSLIATFSMTAVYAASVEIEWWHPFSSSKGEVVAQLVEAFNASNPGVVVTAVHKGGYAETMNAGIAAFRAGEHPNLILALARDASTLMTSGAVVPVQSLMSNQGIDVDWSGFIAPALAAFSDERGLVSLPFNSSTPLLWYNVDAFNAAGIISAPETWDEVEEVSRKLVAGGHKCGLISGWPNWVHLDSYSQMHELEVATNNNGMDGWDTELIFDKEAMFVKHMERLKSWIDEGLYTYGGRTGGTAREAFATQRCAMAFLSSSSFGKVRKEATFKFSAAFLPYESGTDNPRNSMVGGGSIFVFDGHPDEEGASAKFLEFLMQTPQQILWHQKTGYAPISLAAYEQLKSEGYYDENPHQELAILQLNRGGEPGALNRGIRFGYASQVYTAINEELEKAWAGDIELGDALATAARRGNEIIDRFVVTTQ